MPNAPRPVDRRWGMNRPTAPGRGRRRRLLAVLLALVALVAVVVGVLAWLSPPTPPRALTVWVTAEPGAAGVVPWAAQDRAALTHDDLLGRPTDDAPNPTRDQIRLRFRALATAPRDVPLVVHLAAPAAVDAAGGVYLLPADPLGDHPRNRLPLAELLGYVGECPARHKLVVLALSPPAEDPPAAPPPGDLSAAVFRALDHAPDPDRLCLVACGPGETPLASPDLGRSVFGHYLEAGLRGAADGWGPGGDRDGRVTAGELAAYTRGRAARWAETNLRPAQTPTLVGTAADFTVRSYSLSRSSETDESKQDSTQLSTYPDWLRAGWEQHDRWLADGRATDAPRALHLLRDALLAAERDLWAGRDAGEAQRGYDAKVAAVTALAAALAETPAPAAPPTLAATFPRPAAPDAALRDALERLAIQADATPAPAPSAAPGDKPAAPPAPPPPLAPEVEKLFREKPHRDLAAAAFRLLADDPAPSAARVRRLAQVLAGFEPAPKFAETLLIRRLADLADPAVGGPWSAERAALAFQAARAVEGAAARPEVVAWAGPALDRAHRARGDAEAVLFAPGYASPAEAGARLRAAAEACRAVAASADALAAATKTRDEAAGWLAALAPVVEAGPVPPADAVRLADAAAALADALAPPEKPLDDAAFAALARTLRERDAAVRAALGPVAAPFRPETLARLRDRVGSGDVTAASLAHLDAVLRTPFPAAADRAALWDARAAAARRLNDEVTRRDAADDETVRRGLAQPDATDPREPAPPATTDPDGPGRRAAWAVALLRVGGLSREADSLRADAALLAADPPGFAARVRRAWLEDVPARVAELARPAAARLAAVAPRTPATAFLDQPDRNPAALLRRDHARRLWAWQAARFDHEARDPADPRPGDGTGRAFAAQAARSAAAVAGLHAVPYLEITPPATAPKLTPEQPAADLRVDLRLVGPGALPVTTRALSPDPEWVGVTGGGTADLGPARGRPAAFGLAAGTRPFAHAEARGVLVEAEAGGRTFHRRVPVSLDALVTRLDLLVQTGPAAEPRAVREVVLRPHWQDVPLQLHLSNPTQKGRTVVARLAGFDVATKPVEVAAESRVLLRFTEQPAAPLPPANEAKEAKEAKAEPAAPTPPGPASAPLTGPLVVEITDPKTPDKVEQRFTLPARVLDPAEYLKVDEVAYRPTGTRPNRLSVRVVPESPPPGPPAVQVTAALPPARNPDVLQVRDANLSGPLPAGNRPLTLYAEDVTFAAAGGGRVVVTVGADGVDRAFTFEGAVADAGGTVRLAAVPGPMVRVNPPGAPWYSVPGEPLAVPLEVDNAPDGARVELRLGTARPGPAGFEVDAAETVAPARDRDRGIRFDPKGETIFVRGRLRDPIGKLPVGLLVGSRTLEARLVSATNKELAFASATVVFDGTAPTNVQFLDLPAEAGKGVPLRLRATCDPTVAGVREVKFFVGPPADGKLPAAPAPVPGKLVNAKTNEWQADVQPGTADRATVGVRFTTNTGKERTVTADVVLIDPAVLNKPKPGKIVGTLTEGKFKLDAHPVVLRDEKQAPLAEVKTKADGTFEFPAVLPGKYFLYAARVESNRVGLVPVEVAAGATVRRDVPLHLKGSKDDPPPPPPPR